MSNCTQCKHSEVCKFRDELKKYETKVLALPKPEFISLSISCKYYDSEPQIYMRGAKLLDNEPPVKIEPVNTGTIPTNKNLGK